MCNFLSKDCPILHCHFADRSEVCDGGQHRSQTLLDRVQEECGLGQSPVVDVDGQCDDGNDEECEQDGKVGLLRSDSSLLLFVLVLVLVVVVDNFIRIAIFGKSPKKEVY